MARREIVEFVDDIDGGDDATVKTRHINIGGVAREIDLSDKNYDLMMAAIAPFIEASRPVKPAFRSYRGAKTGPGGLTSAERKAQNDTIRNWGKSQGEKVSERGRVSAALTERWMAAGQPKGPFSSPVPAKPAVKKAVPAAEFTADLVTQAAAKEAVVPTQKKAPAKRASRVKAEVAA